MKKLFLILGLVGAALPACAMLGENRTQSIHRYGKPFTVNGNFAYYHARGYVVCQWYDPEGICEVSAYFKLQGDITKPEAERIAGASLPSTVQPSDWIEQNSTDPSTRRWTTLDGKWYWESGVTHLGTSKRLYSSLVIGTVNGVVASSHEIDGWGNKSDPALEKPEGDI
jgi:hypothetical protein